MSLKQSAYFPLLLVVNVVAGGRRGGGITEKIQQLELTARDHTVLLWYLQQFVLKQNCHLPYNGDI